MTWHCAYTNPQQEGLVESEFKRLGFEFFAPRLEVESKTGEVKTTFLFPRYLFVSLDLDGHWQPARYARGVRAILGTVGTHIYEGEPAPIAERTILELRSRCNDQGRIVVKPRLPAAGDTVVILKGPFINFQAMCLSSSAKRVEVLLSLFGRSSHAAFNPQDVEVARTAA